MDIKKVEAAKARVKEAVEKFGDTLFSGHSGGKDSCVIHHLVQQFKPDVELVHNTKPMLYECKDDPVAQLTAMYPPTLEFLYSKVMRKYKVHAMPATMMPDFVKEAGFQCQVDGARVAEAERPGKSSNFIVNGEPVNRKLLTPVVENGMFGLTVIYPIYDWSDDDVFDYCVENGIELSEEYLENGEIDAYLERKKNAEK